MTDTLHIAQVAEQAGVSPATIRYYERIGVLPSPSRAANGYRVYHGDTVDRLRFVARAKALGCTLDEIADLVLAWGGGECGPVQDRLRALVAAKTDETRAGITELVAFLAELHRAAAGLDRPPKTGPCDDGCGCLRHPDDGLDASGTGSGCVDPAPVAGGTVAIELTGRRPGSRGDWRGWRRCWSSSPCGTGDGASGRVPDAPYLRRHRFPWPSLRRRCGPVPDRRPTSGGPGQVPPVRCPRASRRWSRVGSQLGRGWCRVCGLGAISGGRGVVSVGGGRG